MGITLLFGSLDIIKIFVFSRSQIGCKMSFILVLNVYYFYVLFLSARIEQMSVENGTGSTGAQKKKKHTGKKALRGICYHGHHLLVPLAFLTQLQ